MALYLVENEEAPINYRGCYWIVEAKNRKEAINKVYTVEAQLEAPKESGIFKRKLYAFRIDELLDNGIYNIL